MSVTSQHANWHVFNASNKILCWWWELQYASRMDTLVTCIGQVWFFSFFHTVFKSRGLCGPLLWTLSVDFSAGFKSGDWLRNQLRVSLAVFGMIALLKHPPSFHHHNPGGGLQIFINSVIVHVSVTYWSSVTCIIHFLVCCVKLALVLVWFYASHLLWANGCDGVGLIAGPHYKHCCDILSLCRGISYGQN